MARTEIALRSDQVYICFDGPDGLVMQVSLEGYENYYRLLGWELLGKAEMLPGFAQRHGEPVAAERRQRLGSGYGRLFPGVG